ncbi:MAG TPA: hypothetical protein VIN58_25845 [Roseateles sp.]
MEHIQQFTQQDLAGAELELAGQSALKQSPGQTAGNDVRDEQIRVEHQAHDGGR